MKNEELYETLTIMGQLNDVGRRTLLHIAQGMLLQTELDHDNKRPA